VGRVADAAARRLLRVGAGSITHVTPEFIWIMFVLKIPLVALLLLVWYAIRATPEPAEDEEGGSGRRPHPRSPRGAGPQRRGPHTGVPVPAPRRVRLARTTFARGRLEHGRR
jgi:hypothetical protein